ncbi:MAG: hypothetical protein KGI06_01730 [Candidatus Micrarchaeota archaeon]|nr:hypothetical protein [Candidatus Micrarchaeota archaeon]
MSTKDVNKEKLLGRKLAVFRTSYTGVFKPVLEGYHFKFTLLLPISEEKKIPRKPFPVEKSIFTSADLDTLEVHFGKHLGGYTNFRYKAKYSREELKSIPKEFLPFLPETPIGVPHILTSPTIRGAWINKKKKTIVNKHARYEVYTLRHNNAMEYFKKLRRILEEHSKEKIIVIEQSEITIVPGISPDVKPLLREIRNLRKKQN